MKRVGCIVLALEIAGSAQRPPWTRRAVTRPDGGKLKALSEKYEKMR